MALKAMAQKGVWLCSTRALARLSGLRLNTLHCYIQRNPEEFEGMRVGRTHFLNPHLEKPMNALAQLAPALRPGSHYYLSMESVLHEHDWISQIPNRLTFVTNGRPGVYDTPLGVIEFSRVSVKGFERLRMAETYFDPQKLVFVATPQLAFRDLKSVGRNVDLVREPEPDNNSNESQRGCK